MTMYSYNSLMIHSTEITLKNRSLLRMVLLQILLHKIHLKKREFLLLIHRIIVQIKNKASITNSKFLKDTR